MVLQIGKHKISIWYVVIITFILFTATACKSQTNIYEKELLSDEIIPTDYIIERNQAEIVLEQLDEDIEEVLDANKSDENITIVSIDGTKEIELIGTWAFKTIESKGSDDARAKSLDYGMHSSCWGNAISFNSDGSGMMIYSYKSDGPVYEPIDWKIIRDSDNSIGIIYEGSDFGFILKFVDIENGNPKFRMIDSTGSDNSYGSEYIRMAELEKVNDVYKSGGNISYKKDPIEPEDNIKEIIKSITAGKIESADVWWSHYPTERYIVLHFADEDFLNHWGSIQGELNDSDLDYIINILNETDFEILEEQPTANTDFLISLDFEDGSTIRLTADDQEIYMSIRNNGDWIHTKVLHIDLFEYLLGFAGEGGIDIDVISGTESVTICYIKDSDRKNYPENGRITEIEITDSEIIKRIKEAIFSNISKTMTYPSREYADIIFHTLNGDYYGKIKFPITTDENGISEPTIIIEGYYWYECEELYNILIEIENAQ